MDRSTLTDVSMSGAGAYVGDIVQMAPPRTRWQRMKHLVWVRVFRRPDPDVARIVGMTATTLTLDRMSDMPIGITPMIIGTKDP